MRSSTHSLDYSRAVEQKSIRQSLMNIKNTQGRQNSEKVNNTGKTIRDYDV